MNKDEFIETVKLMRKAQKDFFSSRSKEALRIAKRLELLVDHYLRLDEAEKPDPKQTELF